MKQSEQLDLILKYLYQFKNNNVFYKMDRICTEANIPTENKTEQDRLRRRLVSDNYVQSLSFGDGEKIRINTYGIDYCENDSYTLRGHSIVTNNYTTHITGSPNSSVITNSEDVNITNNKQDV